MNPLKLLGAIALVVLVQPAQAALWSVSNEITRPGDKAVLTVSLTGDGITHGTNVDLVIPRGFSVIDARSQNGGMCAIRPNANPQAQADIVAIINIAPSGPITDRARPQCLVTVVANRHYGDWFRLTSDECYDGAIQPRTCVLDPGYVTVLP